MSRHDIDKIRYCVRTSHKDTASDWHTEVNNRYFKTQGDVCVYLLNIEKEIDITDPVVFKCSFEEWGKSVIDDMVSRHIKRKEINDKI